MKETRTLRTRRMAELLRKQLLDTTRGRIGSSLQTGGLTSDDISTVPTGRSY
jgi:hypothetical protein